VFARQLAQLQLPVPERDFQAALEAARQAALHSFEMQLLGRSQASLLVEQLGSAMQREGDIKATANVAKSNELCQVGTAWEPW
jgi:hypothetical protein